MVPYLVPWAKFWKHNNTIWFGSPLIVSSAYFYQMKFVILWVHHWKTGSKFILNFESTTMQYGFWIPEGIPYNHSSIIFLLNFGIRAILSSWRLDYNTIDHIFGDWVRMCNIIIDPSLSQCENIALKTIDQTLWIHSILPSAVVPT